MRNEDLFISPEEDSYDFRERYSKVVDGYCRYRILRAASEMGFFDNLHDLSTAEEVAERMGTDTGMNGLMCKALAEMGFIDEIDGRYVNTKSADLYLVSTSGLCLKDTFDIFDDSLRIWDSLEESVRKGNCPADEDPKRFHRSMTAFGRFSKGGFIAELMDFIEDGWMVPGKTLLDVAGGHGLYSVALKTRYPQVDVRYFDRSQGAKVAIENFREYGVRIDIIVGNFCKDGVPGCYDILVSSFNDTACKPDLAHVLYDAIKPGGLLVVRRYVIQIQDPMERVIQANISRPEGSPLRSGHRGQEPEERTQYDREMQHLGLMEIKRERTGKGTEMIAYRKGV